MLFTQGDPIRNTLRTRKILQFKRGHNLIYITISWSFSLEERRTDAMPGKIFHTTNLSPTLTVLHCPPLSLSHTQYHTDFLSRFFIRQLVLAKPRAREVDMKGNGLKETETQAKTWTVMYSWCLAHTLPTCYSTTYVELVRALLMTGTTPSTCLNRA